MMKYVKYVGAGVGALIVGAILMLGATKVVYPAISSLVGLAVAQSATLWNNVIDAAKGDAQTKGILAESLYMYNGTTFDRLRGTIANGILVDVTRITGNVTVVGTATDNTANSTAKLPVIPCRANAAAPAWTEGNQVPCSTDLAGGMRIAGGGSSSPVQGTTLLNSETVSAADTATVKTLTGVASTRIHIYKLKVTCGAGASSMSITDGGTTIYSTNTGGIPSLPNTFEEVWPTGLTFTTGATAVVTIGTCGAGNVSALDLQADQF